jgi:nitrite reductase/ring-hydroxylating ferredoxin subunit
MTMTDTRYPLCRAGTVPEDDARGFRVDTPDGPCGIILVNSGGRLHAYLNRCPHTGVNLDWVPDRFLDGSLHYIQCATHGALFRMHDGFCILGPCAGRSLEAVPMYRERDVLGIILRGPAA